MRGRARLLSVLSALMTTLYFIDLKPIAPASGWAYKMIVGSLIPILGVFGAVGAFFSGRAGARRSMWAGLLGAALSAVHIWQVSKPHRAFESAFGDGWRAFIGPRQRAVLLPERYQPRLPATKAPRVRRDVIYATAPETEQPLRCDLWLPPWDVRPSGLAVIFCHGGGWRFGSKGIGMDPFFAQFAAGGHLVMDIDYRLAPQTRLPGMIADVKRAVAYLKQHAATYNLNPDRIVLAGSSAGAHLALLCAYAPQHPELTPDDLRDQDLSVRAVVSICGPADLEALHHYTPATLGETMLTRTPVDRLIGRGLFALLRPAPEASDWLTRFTDLGGVAAQVIDGPPSIITERYGLGSPITHVTADSPPTLLLQAELDSWVPIESVKRLHQRLCEAGVQAVYIQYPRTEHGFEVFLPQVSPAGQATIYDIERFLALMV